MKTVDGFPIQDSFDWLPTKPDPSINEWSWGKEIKVEVWFDDWYLNHKNNKFAKWVTWKGKTWWDKDFDWTMAMVKQSMANKFYPKSKEQALDEHFEILEFMYEYARKHRDYRKEIQEWYDMQKPSLLGYNTD